MQNRILLLLSNLRGIDKLVYRFKTCFPYCEVTPIIFLDEGESTSNKEYQVITHDKLKDYCSAFDFTGVKLLYVSFMTGDKVSFIKRSPSKIKVVWAIPGGDLYNRYLRYFRYSLIYKEKKNVKYVLGKMFRRFFRRAEFNYLINRCTGVDCAFCDYDLIKHYTPEKINVPIHIYNIGYPIEKMLGPLKGKDSVSKDEYRIIIGNSASRTNNHLYVLKCLKKVNLKDISLSLFLSYGDDKRYKSEVISKFSQAYQEKVTFITDFLPLEDFNHILLSATHFIYGNWRQEAVGNILTALYLGGKVYLSQKNPLLDGFREMGFNIYCLEEIGEDFYEEINEFQKLRNRELITKLYNEERAQELFKQGLTPLLTS